MIWNAGIKVQVGSRSDSNKSSLRGQYQHEHNHGHIINSCVKKGRRDESAPAGCLCRGFVQDTHHIKSSGRGFMRGPYHMYKQARSRARGGGARGEGREGRRGRGDGRGGRRERGEGEGGKGGRATQYTCYKTSRYGRLARKVGLQERKKDYGREMAM